MLPLALHIIFIVLGVFIAFIFFGMLLMAGAHRTKSIIPDKITLQSDGVQYVGHATTFLRIDGTNILTDPILTQHFAVFFKRFVSLGLDQSVLGKINIVLISHWHKDHFHPRSLTKLNRDIELIVPIGIGSKLKRMGFKNIHELKVGDKVTIKNINFEAVPTIHGSAKNAIGFIIKGSWTVYFPGDTAYAPTIFEDLGKRFSIDLALLPIGCYRGRIFYLIPVSFENIHMPPEKLVPAVKLLHPKRVFPIHWGTFIIGSEPIHEAEERLRAIMKEQGESFPVRILPHGSWIAKQDFLNRN